MENIEPYVIDKITDKGRDYLRAMVPRIHPRSDLRYPYLYAATEIPEHEELMTDMIIVVLTTDKEMTAEEWNKLFRQKIPKL